MRADVPSPGRCDQEMIKGSRRNFKGRRGACIFVGCAAIILMNDIQGIGIGCCGVVFYVSKAHGDGISCGDRAAGIVAG